MNNDKCVNIINCEKRAINHSCRQGSIRTIEGSNKCSDFNSSEMSGLDKYFEVWNEESVDHWIMRKKILEFNTIYTNVSNTFVNAFVNCGIPLKLYQIDRYNPDVTSNLKLQPIVNKSIVAESKSKLRELIISNVYNPIHTDLSVFRDDIVLLKLLNPKDNSEELEPNIFLFMYYDCDVSDCMIGRIKTTDSQQLVILEIENWLKSMRDQKNIFKSSLKDNLPMFAGLPNTVVIAGNDQGILNYHELPVKFLQGWISF